MNVKLTEQLVGQIREWWEVNHPGTATGDPFTDVQAWAEFIEPFSLMVCHDSEGPWMVLGSCRGRGPTLALAFCAWAIGMRRRVDSLLESVDLGGQA